MRSVEPRPYLEGGRDGRGVKLSTEYHGSPSVPSVRQPKKETWSEARSVSQECPLYHDRSRQKSLEDKVDLSVRCRRSVSVSDPVITP